MTIGTYTTEDGEQVEAMLLTADLVTVVSVWCSGVPVETFNPLTDQMIPALNVGTPEGPKRASLGDYVLKRKDSTFDVERPNAFRRKFRLDEGDQ